MSRRENPLVRRLSEWADRAGRAASAAVRASAVGSAVRRFLRAPSPAFVTVDAGASVAFRIVARLSKPVDRPLSVAERTWATTVAPYPLRATSILVGPVAALQFAQEASASGPTATGSVAWAVLLALSLVGLVLPLDWAAVRRTRTGRALAAVLFLPDE